MIGTHGRRPLKKNIRGGGGDRALQSNVGSGNEKITILRESHYLKKKQREGSLSS